jgi:hypothetical protein
VDRRNRAGGGDSADSGPEQFGVAALFLAGSDRRGDSVVAGSPGGQAFADEGSTRGATRSEIHAEVELKVDSGRGFGYTAAERATGNVSMMIWPSASETSSLKAS